MLKKIVTNLLRAIGIMLYFIILNLAYTCMKQERLIRDIEVFAGAFLVIGIAFLEKAYKKDNSSIAVNGIEFLVLSLHSLSIMHIITIYKYDFRFYLLTSSYIVSIYYVLKAIIFYTKGRREYLNSLSDISEIVKKDEPVVKEAKKRTNKVEIKKIEEGKSNKKTTKQKAKTLNTKSKNGKKKETKEEVKIQEKKKRGKPKKEVMKND